MSLWENTNVYSRQLERLMNLRRTPKMVYQRPMKKEAEGSNVENRENN